MGRWLKKAGITCVLSTFLKANDDKIIPHHANPNHALMKVGNDGDSVLHVKIGLQCESDSQTHAPQSWHQGWQVRIQWCRYRGCITNLISIKSSRCFHIIPYSWRPFNVSNVLKKSRLPKCFQQRRTSARLSGYRDYSGQVLEL